MTIGNTGRPTRVIEHREIFHDEMLALMRIMSGEMSPVMIAAFAIGLRVKKETIGEIAAAAQVMREFATRWRWPTARTWWTSSAPAATARTASTSARRRCSWRPLLVRAGGQACRPQRVVHQRAGSADVVERSVPTSTCRLSRWPNACTDRHRLHVRAQPPSGHEARGAGAQGDGRATIFNILGR